MQELLATIIGEEAAALIASELKGNYTNLYRKEKEELMEIEGIDAATADKVRAIVEFSEDLYTRQAEEDLITINDEESMIKYVNAKLSHKQEEFFMVLILDSGYHFIGDDVISKGGTTGTTCAPKDVFRKAIKIGGKNIILVHNHPTGDLTPSKDDVLVTRRLAKLGLFLGVEIADHLIIGRNKHYSMTYNGHLNIQDILKATEDMKF